MNDGLRIIEEVAARHRLPVGVMVAPGRRRELVAARREAVLRLRQETNLPLKAIGCLLGGRHHSTILHALKSAQA